MPITGKAVLLYHNDHTEQRLDELEDRKKEIEMSIVREEMQKPMYSREDVVYWLCRFRTLDVEKLDERRRLIDSFVNSVTIFDDHILIAFNYKDGTETVPFSTVEGSDLSSVGGPNKKITPIYGSNFFMRLTRYY